MKHNDEFNQNHQRVGVSAAFVSVWTTNLPCVNESLNSEQVLPRWSKTHTDIQREQHLYVVKHFQIQNIFNTDQRRITVHDDQLPTYPMGQSAISLGAFGVACDWQSSCTTASRLWPPWWWTRLPDVCRLRRGWLAGLDCGLVTLTSSWLPDALAWNRSPCRWAWSNPAVHLTGGLEGPELPWCNTLPPLKHNEGELTKKSPPEWHVSATSFWFHSNCT